MLWRGIRLALPGEMVKQGGGTIVSAGTSTHGLPTNVHGAVSHFLTIWYRATKPGGADPPGCPRYLVPKDVREDGRFGT